MPRAELLGLGRKQDVGLVLEVVADLVGRVADHDHDRLGPGPPRRVDDVADHRPAAHLVQDLGLFRLHPLALAGGQDDRDWSVHRVDISRIRERVLLHDLRRLRSTIIIESNIGDRQTELARRATRAWRRTLNRVIESVRL